MATGRQWPSNFKLRHYRRVSHIVFRNGLLLLFAMRSRRWLWLLPALLVVFWFVDVPATTRLKADLIQLLPIAAETKREMIQRICYNSVSPTSVGNCFSANLNLATREELANVEKRELMCDAINQVRTKYPASFKGGQFNSEKQAVEYAVVEPAQAELGGHIMLVYLDDFDYRRCQAITFGGLVIDTLNRRH